MEKASFIFERRRRSMREWAVLRMAFLVGLLPPGAVAGKEEELTVLATVEVVDLEAEDAVFLRLFGD
jgi:hypothetical protein